jgi:hypothetical protein
MFGSLGSLGLMIATDSGGGTDGGGGTVGISTSGATSTSSTSNSTSFTTGISGGSVAPSGAGSPAFGSFGLFGPWGQGVYTPLNWPATRFLGGQETLSNAPEPGATPNTDLIKWLAIGALALWIFGK